jgi:hypothetical protein
MRSVLANIVGADIIYSDPQFGMDTISKLYFWAQACIDATPSSTIYTNIVNYFTSKGIPLTDAQM